MKINGLKSAGKTWNRSGNLSRVARSFGQFFPGITVTKCYEIVYVHMGPRVTNKQSFEGSSKILTKISFCECSIEEMLLLRSSFKGDCLLFRVIFFRLKQSLPLNWNVFSCPILNDVHATSASLFTFLNVTFFSSNCRNFAVECDWNSKIYQNVQNFVVFLKKNTGFSQKNLEWFEFC